MNETNHKRVIDKFAKKVTISKNDVEILKAASDFSDSPNAEWKYYYYHFYYDINIIGDAILLKRVDENTNKSSESMNQCGNHGIYTDLHDDKRRYYDSWSNEKEFFSTFINGRKKSRKSDVEDIGNQSDNVAFLHAMGAEGEDFNTSLKEFENHLRRCFSEYLFIEQPKKALFMLGIAFHGIMDSFTPSHMYFQKYNEQNKGLHAQGDVLPIDDNDKEMKDEKGNTILKFIPGQYNTFPNSQKFYAKYRIGFDDDNILNDLEYEMLRSFLIISKVSYKKDRKTLSVNEINNLCSHFKKHDLPLKRINTVLSNGFSYGDGAFDYSNKAVDVMEKIYTMLSGERKKITTYQDFKNSKCYCEKAIACWKEEFKTLDTNVIFRSTYLNGFRRNSRATSAKDMASTVYHIGVDTLVGTGEAMVNMAIEAGETVVNVASEAGGKAVEIAKSILEQYDNLYEKNQQIDSGFRMPGGPNKV